MLNRQMWIYIRNYSSGYENNIGSTRLIELEEMLDGLKQKFSTLKNGDLLRL